MEAYLSKSYQTYFNTLKQTGYVGTNKTITLLILTFIHRLVENDYRGIISKDNYNKIEKAIQCLLGNNCLIPYRDYLKMGKLHIGGFKDLLYRICNLEQNTENADYTEILNKINELSSTIATLNSRVTNLNSSVTNLNTTVVNNNTTVKTLASQYSALDTRLSSFITQVTSTVNSLAYAVKRMDLNISNTIDNIIAFLQDNTTWIEKILEVNNLTDPNLTIQPPSTYDPQTTGIPDDGIVIASNETGEGGSITGPTA